MALSRSSRTPLMAALRRCFRQASHSPQGGGLSRRDFLQNALVLGTGVLLPGCKAKPPSRALSGGGPRVAVVGAGIAGLAAAHRLSREGIKAPVFEAAQRVGGRILTLAELVAPGTSTEAGGEFID